MIRLITKFNNRQSASINLLQSQYKTSYINQTVAQPPIIQPSIIQLSHRTIVLIKSIPRNQIPSYQLNKYQQQQHHLINNHINMFSFILVVFQLFFVIMLGSFYRSKNFTSLDNTQVTYGLVTLLGFILMGSTYRKLTIFSLVLLLFISFLTIEINFLFFEFWQSCFTSFSKQVDITTKQLISSVYAALAVIITCLDFLGMFEYWQIFAIISFIMTIGSSLVSNIIFKGLGTYDGGFGVGVFLFSGVCSLMIWMLSIRGKISVLEHKKSQSYINYTLGFIGVAITFFSWPVLNIGGSNLTQSNTNLSSQTSLSQSAYINTIAALGVPLLISSFLSSHQTKSDKLNPKIYIECFINAGIVVSSFADVSLHPVAGMTLALVSTIVTLVVNKYLVSQATVRNQSDFKMVLMKFSKILFRILWSFISVCIGAIVVKTRSDSSFGLLTDTSLYSKKAGLMVAGWIIGLIVALVFGAITAALINVYMNYRTNANTHQKVTKITDEFFFDQLQTEIFPIYTDILQVQPDKTYQQDLTRRVLHQSLLLQQQIPLNIYQTNKKQSNHDTQSSGKVQKQTLVIKNDFSKSKLINVDKRDINLSAMKVRNDEEPIAKETIPNTKIIQSKNNIVVQPIDTPIKMLEPGNSRYYQSYRPQQNKAENPKVLNPNPSSSKLGQIYVIQQESNQKKRPPQIKEDPRKKLDFQDAVIEEEQIAQQGIKRVNS